ncbi:calcium/sodium antiporter [Catalinimonas niigatensis]|uniref:calcium/sodium antiporter n=1 Tax=Catalinimonas niigatensis TaxID=1397264 RepID=UPI0026670AE7|nr:calcium/sodium antiporter [Catalinimonas niigatensis]WPP51920.1 calcium/sodium antiporter [Catalinimonas niigatensis]
MINDILLILLSLTLLYFGASWLVNGASSLAMKLGITPLVVGLTVVAFGTSTPELIVSIQAALQGNGGIAVGNVVGSNIFNIGVILGLSALCYPIVVKAEILRIDVPVMLITAVAFTLLFINHTISRLEGIILLSSSIVYTIYIIRQSRKESNAEVNKEFEEGVPKIRTWWMDSLFMIIGLATLIFGSNLLVDNAVSLAKLFQVSDAVIGLTIIAAGTSMPELATSVVAALKKQSDIALGNVVGSNIYNILAILGTSSIITPIYSPDIDLTDSLVMVGISVLLIPLVKSGFVLKRWEGAVLLMGYAFYLYSLLP